MRRLLVAIHDVTPAHGPALREAVEELSAMGIGRCSMLVVPDFHGEWPLEKHPGFCRWLSGLSDSGVEMLLHGMTHMDRSSVLSLRNRIRRLMFTRGEGEFLGIDAEAALELMLSGRDRLQEAIGCRVQGFVAPAWLYGAGAMEALKEAGFSLAESRTRIWSPSMGITLSRVPVSNYAGGGAVKRGLAALWVRLSGTILGRSDVFRFAIHPADLSSEGSKRSLLAALRRFSAGREPSVLADLLPAP